MLKEALAGLPTRPVLYLSSIVLVLGLGYHFTTTYQSCRSHAELRESLHAAIKASADGTVPGPVRLSRITDFPWDRADVLVNYKPGGSTTNCPFQWDWPRETREDLIARDLLTVIVFLQGGKLVNYLEYRRDWADFVDVENPYTAETAVFDVSPSPNDPYAFILSPSP
jgi:hypothetical protein